MSENNKELIQEAINTFDENEIIKVINKLLNSGENPIALINIISDILAEIGRKFSDGELFLPHLVATGEAVGKSVNQILIPSLKKTGKSRETKGKVILGTIEGDIHDIGKNIIGSLLFANGFEVIDLGNDVPPSKFIQKAKESKANVIGVSALLIMTMTGQKDVIEKAKEAGIRDKVKIIVGGAPVTQKWANDIGADGMAEDANEAVELVKKLILN